MFQFAKMHGAGNDFVFLDEVNTPLTKDHTALVCGMNLAFAKGLVAEIGAEEIDVRLDPKPGTCCVALVVASRKSRSS